MRTSSRPVAVVLFDEIELLDVASVVSVLSAAGRQWNFRPFRIVPTAKLAAPVDTRSQLRVEAKCAFADCPPPEIVVVPGGYGARRATSDAEVVAFLKRVGPGATHLLGVGNGVLLLAAAGLVENEDVAVPPDAAVPLGELSRTARPDVAARYRESGKVLSAATASAAADAALHLVSKLLGRKQAEGVAQSLGLTWSEGDASGVKIVER